MKIFGKTLVWAALFFAMSGLFCRYGGMDAAASVDERTPLTLYTEEGPVTVTMAEYLPCAVAAEMPASFGAEALKAQAVAARTYALACRRHGQAGVCTQSGCCIAYMDEPALRALWGKDYEKNRSAVEQAVAATDGQYLRYGGAAIQAVFHASSLGATENSGALWAPLPYLVSVESPESAQENPELISTVTVGPDAFADALGLQARGEPGQWVEGVSRDEAGRVAWVSVCGQSYTGGELRGLFGLRSTDFTLDWDGAAFTFTVSGYGHGVGMSQYGARTYAARGWTYEDILAHYYPGAELAEHIP